MHAPGLHPHYNLFSLSPLYICSSSTDRITTFQIRCCQGNDPCSARSRYKYSVIVSSPVPFPWQQPLCNHATRRPSTVLELNLENQVPSSPLDCSIVDSGPCLFDTSVSSRVRNKYMKTINVEFDELCLKVKKVDVLFEDKRNPERGLMRYTYDVSKSTVIS